MFKFLIVLVACTALVLAAPAKEDKEQVEIVKSEITKHEDGSYQVAYETGDGTQREEEATVVGEGTDAESLEIKGSYKYINDDGDEVEVFYTAGVNGFVPYGSVINPEITAVAKAAKDLPKDEDDYKKRGKSSE